MTHKTYRTYIIPRITGFLATLAVTLWGALLATPALAQVTSEVEGLALTGIDPRIIVARVIRIALGLLGVVAVAIVLYGGYLWMTAAGNEEKIEKARKLLVNGVIGLAIILSAFAITQFILSRLLQATRGPQEGAADVPAIGREGQLRGAFLARSIEPRGAVSSKKIIVKITLSDAPQIASVDSETVKITYVQNGEAVPGTLQVGPLEVAGRTMPYSNRVITFLPDAPCAEAPQYRCFDENTEFRVRLSSDLRRARDGAGLYCAFGALCGAEFTSGYEVDLTAPQADLRRHPQAIAPDGAVNLQIVATDNAGVALAEAYHEQSCPSAGEESSPDLIEARGPEGETTPREFTLNTFWAPPSGIVAPSIHEFFARVYDIDTGATETGRVSAAVRPVHCFNEVQDTDLGETGVDCGGVASACGRSACGACRDDECNENTDCADDMTCVREGDAEQGVCSDGPPIIVDIVPGDGRAETLVSVVGLNFGASQGQIFFTNAERERVEAGLPLQCQGVATWSENLVLVAVPDGAADGPITLVRADGEEDQSDDISGPLAPSHEDRRAREVEDLPPDGWFDVNEAAHPGICSIRAPDPLRCSNDVRQVCVSDADCTGGGQCGPQAAGLWHAAVEIQGAELGTENGHVWFGEVPTAAIANWGQTRIDTAVPVADYGLSRVQVADASGALSNVLNFRVLSPDAATNPQIEQVTPSQGGEGQGFTVFGSHFGSRIGAVWFVALGDSQTPAEPPETESCGSNWWTPTEIRVKVPAEIDPQDAKIYVQRYDLAISNQVDFKVTNVPAGPFLACLNPVAGPVFSDVRAFGENLGSQAIDPEGLYFTREGSPTIFAFPENGAGMILNTAWQRVRAAVRGWRSSRVKVQVPGEENNSAATGQVIAERTVDSITRYSNPLSFTVGSCLAPAGDPLRLDCGAFGEGMQCCGDGSCALRCPEIVSPVSKYGWQFTTSPALNRPHVLEQCDTAISEGHPAYPPSPAPWAVQGRAAGAQVCVNAAVSVFFNIPVIAERLNADNIIIEKCTAPTALILGNNSTFAGDPTIWRQPNPPDIADAPPHESHLGVQRVSGQGHTPESADSTLDRNFALELTQIEDDAGPGWPDARGVQANFEHWFGYQADAIPDNTNGTFYRASAWVRPEANAVDRRVGILIQRNNSVIGDEDAPGFWQKSSRVFELRPGWQELSAEIQFTEGVNGAAPGYVRIFFEGLPHDIRPGDQPLPLSARPIIYVDDVKVEGSACRETEAVNLDSGPLEIIADQEETGAVGLRFWPATGFEPNLWYRVSLLSGEDGIRAPGELGAPLEISPAVQTRCGADRYCFTFKTRDSTARCEIGRIAVSPNPWTATEEFEEVDYTAIPVAAEDACIPLNPGGYPWRWSSSDPQKAGVNFNPSASPPQIGHSCSDSAQCTIQPGTCSNNPAVVCMTDAQCGQGNTCVRDDQSCQGGVCRFMPWTTTAIAYEETEVDPASGQPLPVQIQAHSSPITLAEGDPIYPEITGSADLTIDFGDPRIIGYWPSCGSACTNAAVGAAFNRPMLDLGNGHDGSITNTENVMLWAAPCGNGIVDPGEDCDDGDIVSGDGCSAICLREGSGAALRIRCGNGVVDPGEDCDDGNNRSGDGCSEQCLNEGVSGSWTLPYPSTIVAIPPTIGVCGNGIREFDSMGRGEECDDGNTQDGDGCSARCLNEGTRSDFAVCGNRRLDRGEECEINFDGVFEAWCDPESCLRRVAAGSVSCGNGFIDPGEECDPESALLDTPNKKALCSPDCQWSGTRRPAVPGGQGCGNGRIELGEDCDDGGLRPGDGCNEFCRNEGSVPGTTPACGNGVRDWNASRGGEECDDGNTQDGDGCSARCLNEGTRVAVCGNGVVEDWAEECDPASLPPEAPAGVCNPTNCLWAGTSSTAAPPNNRCGNGRLDYGEDCDGGAFCSATCLRAGRPPARVENITLTWNGARNELSIQPPAGSNLDPNMFYRVLLRGDNPEPPEVEGVHSCRGSGCTIPDEGIDPKQLNFSYNGWGEPSPSVPGAGTCVPGQTCNTFSWTFQTGEDVCQIARVDVAPKDAALYAIGARQRMSAEPFGAPDACSPQGQRLNSLAYGWAWTTADADIATVTEEDLIPSCGNGIREYAEDCDDGNTANGDGCSSRCLSEGSGFAIRCGDGGGCSDANPCPTGESCVVGRCLDPGEDCDDGNAIAGDGCSARCLNEGTRPPFCGNGIVDYGEDCDDGNIKPRDGCSPRCLAEGESAILSHGTAPGATCGNPYVETGEDCDDGNRDFGDGCSSTCRLEGTRAPLCGNGRIDYGEKCDDGNTANGDGCSSRCLNEGRDPVPGSGVNPNSPNAGVDPWQWAIARGIKKFCQNADDGTFDYEAFCIVSGDCDEGENEICRPPNPWSTVAIEASADGVSGNAPLTVFCSARTDKDCPVPGGSQGSPEFGRGFDSCCYGRPEISDWLPRIGATEACPNALLQLQFEGLIDPLTVSENIRVAKRPAGEDCPAGSVRLLPDGTLEQGAQSGGRSPSFWHRLWGRIKDLAVKVFPSARAQDEVWCVADDLVLDSSVESGADSGIDISIVTLEPSRLLDTSADYKIVIVGDRDINDSQVSGLRSIFGVGFHKEDTDGVDERWRFHTKDEVCAVERVQLTVEGSRTFDKSGDNSTISAQAFSADEQPLRPARGYSWQWSWGSSQNAVADVSQNTENLCGGVLYGDEEGTENAQCPEPPDIPEPAEFKATAAPSQTVTAGNTNGTSEITATAVITEDILRSGSAYQGQCSIVVPESEGGGKKCANDPDRNCAVHEDCGFQIGQTRSASEEFTTFLCDNPWPRDPETGALRKFSDVGAGDWRHSPAITPPDTIPTNFSTQYCRDGDTLLPELNYPGAVRVSEALGGPVGGFRNQPELLKEFLWTVNITDQNGQAQEHAIGLRIMSNPLRLPLEQWYELAGLSGNPVAHIKRIDGYPALRDGNTIYAGAINAVEALSDNSRTVYGNVYLVSLSENAPPEIRAIYDQLVDNLTFNINVSNPRQCVGQFCSNDLNRVFENTESCGDPGASPFSKACDYDLMCAPDGSVGCNADKAKLRRDLKRIEDLGAVRAALHDARLRNGRFPVLQAGTFVRSISTSRWPSWGATLGSEIGRPLPKDPINIFADCSAASGEQGTFDPATCWNEQTQTYRCPVGSRIYQYETGGGVTANLRAEFELLERSDTPALWDVPNWPVLDNQVRIETQGVCVWQRASTTPDSTWSNSAAICGNGILEQLPDGDVEECEPGRIDERVVTLDGALRCSGAPDQTCTNRGASCPTDSGRSQGVCLPLTSCVAERACNPETCRWRQWPGSGIAGFEDPIAADCRTGGTFCGNGRVEDERGESCDDGLLNGQYGKCNAQCTGLSDAYCGNGTPEGPEVCDEGEDNGLYGHCRFDCTGQGEQCGDSVVQSESAEQCEVGDTQTSARVCVGWGFNFGKPCTANSDCTTCPANTNCANNVCYFCQPPDAVGHTTSEIQQTTVQGYPYFWSRSCTDSCRWSNAFVAPGWTCTAQGICGNGDKEGAEQCDDGNRVDEDGCTNACRRATCDDGINQGYVCTAGTSALDRDGARRTCAQNRDCGENGLCEDREQCDMGSSLNGVECSAAYNRTCTFCSNQCTLAVRTGAFCGDGVLSGSEVCDGGVATPQYRCVIPIHQIESRPSSCSNSCDVPVCGAGQGTLCHIDWSCAGSEDPDGDGLANFPSPLYGGAEAWYGTDHNNPDSDGDGFSDGEEVRNGYDPRGPGRL